MDSTISLILSRHGETEENKLRIMQGQMPGHLSLHNTQFILFRLSMTA